MSPSSAAMGEPRTRRWRGRQQQRHLLVVGAQPTQLPLAHGDPSVEVVDQGTARRWCPPTARAPQAVQELAAAGTEQVAGGHGRPNPSSVACPRCCNATRWRTRAAATGPARVRHAPRVREPARGHQLAAGQLGQDPGVDPVGPARQRCQPFDLLRVGDLHLPPVQLELVVDEPGAVHRLDRRGHWLTEPGQLPDQPA
jgi:hypothetical protein